jgi:NitT/TauT family transport system substrate-binding protein
MKIVAFLVAFLIAGTAQAQTALKISACGPVMNTGLSPFAVAEKMGYFAEGGISVKLIPMPGSADCVKQVATGDLDYAMPSSEAVALMRLQGVRMKLFYTSYESTIYGVAVPADSPVQSMADLKGKTIGVTSMGSTGVVIAKALAADAGLNPDTDIKIVVGGEGGQTAMLLRNKQMDALSQFDSAYALVENAGVPLRMLKDNEKIAQFPANGLVALESRLADHRAEAVALARGLAMGALFAQTNPEAAVRITWDIYPQTKPLGKTDVEALADGVRPLKARLHAWDPASGGATQYGQIILPHFDAYLAFLLKYGVLKQPVPASEMVTDSLINDANRFDSDTVRKAALAYGK